jgi:hypothetical protein
MRTYLLKPHWVQEKKKKRFYKVTPNLSFRSARVKRRQFRRSK